MQQQPEDAELDGVPQVLVVGGQGGEAESQGVDVRRAEADPHRVA